MFSLQSLFLLACVLSSRGIYRFALTLLNADQYVVPPLSRKALVGVLGLHGFPQPARSPHCWRASLCRQSRKAGFSCASGDCEEPSRPWRFSQAFWRRSARPFSERWRSRHASPTGAISRSALAVADVLLFPLLAVNACLTGLMLLADPPAGVSMAEWLGGSMAICLVLDVLVVR